MIITHDPTTKRCFGIDFDVTKTPYHGVLDQLRSQDKYRERIPTFEEVAQLFATDKTFANVKIMLDVKRTNQPWVIPKVVDILRRVNPDLRGFWAGRIVLGLWRWDVLEASMALCPELPVIFIGFDEALARRFMAQPPVVGISIIYFALGLPSGAKLIEDARRAGKAVWAWTVNSPQAMEWAVAAKIDGIVTDFPDKYKAYLESLERKAIDKRILARPGSVFTWSQTAKFSMIIFLARMYFAFLDFKLYFWSRPPL